MSAASAPAAERTDPLTASAASTPATTADLLKLVASHEEAGPFQPSRGDAYQNFPATRAAFPEVDVPGSAHEAPSFPNLRVHVTLPDVTLAGDAAQRPVVFIYDCWAFGLQASDWYFDYADHLASHGYAVIQFERPSWLQRLRVKLLPSDVEFITRCSLAWVTGGGVNVGAPGGPPKPPDKVAFDVHRLGFVGHSKGGADAEAMLRVDWGAGVSAAAFLMDGVTDRLQAARVLAPLTGGANTGGDRKSILLVKASETTPFNPLGQVNYIRDAANAGFRGRVLACLDENVGHFSFVRPRYLRVIRGSLRRLGIFGHLDTDRPYLTSGGRTGVLNQCRGLMAAWFKGMLDGEGDRVWPGLFPQGHPADWGDNTLPQSPAVVQAPGTVGAAPLE